MAYTPVDVDTPIDLVRLRLFVQVAGVGSLTRAAVANDTTQSVISRQIGALERYCGGALFRRTGRGVTLSPFGEEMLPRVEALLADADRLASDMRSNAATPTGLVAMALVPSLAQPLMEMVLRRLKLEYPGIRLHCSDGSSGRIDKWLEEGVIDLGVPFRYSRVPARERALARVATYLVGASGDPLTAADTIDFTQLDGLPLILPALPNGLRVALEAAAKRVGVTLVVPMEVESLTIQRDIAAAGSAYTILSGNAVAREVQAGLLQAARIVNPRIDRTVTAVLTSFRSVSLATRAVAQVIGEVAEALVADGIWTAPDA